MGIYINPHNGLSKEEWLEQNGVKVDAGQFMPDYPKPPQMLVCLVQNALFSAALCINNTREYVRAMHEITEMQDARPRTWYMVDRAKAAEQVGSFYAKFVIDESLT